MNAPHPAWSFPVRFGRSSGGPVQLQIGWARRRRTGFTANQGWLGIYWEGIADGKGWSKGAGLNAHRGPILVEGDT